MKNLYEFKKVIDQLTMNKDFGDDPDFADSEFMLSRDPIDDGMDIKSFKGYEIEGGLMRLKYCEDGEENSLLLNMMETQVDSEIRFSVFNDYDCCFVEGRDVDGEPFTITFYKK